MRSNFLTNLFFSLLITVLMISSCSAQPPDGFKKIKLTINSGSPIILDVPNSREFSVGDTVKMEAIISSPYQFNGWSGGISGTENPKSFVVNKPLTIMINYNTALAYEVKLTNSKYLSTKIFEFDVVLKTFAEQFVLTAYQVILNYNQLWKNGGTLNLSLEQGSSDLINLPAAGFNVDSTKLTFAAGMAGRDTVGVISKRIGRFMLVNSNEFDFEQPVNLGFNFTEPLNTIFTAENVVNVIDFGSFVFLPEDHKVIIRWE